MAAVNVSSLRGLVERRGGMMLGRAIHNTGMLSDIVEKRGFRAAGRVLGGAASAGAMKGAMIGAGLGVGMSMINDASNNNLNSGSIGRGLGGALKGGLLGGAIGGAGSLGNTMFRGNINRIAAARAKAAAAAAAPKAAPALSRMGRFREFMTRRRGLNDLTGLGPTRPTMANVRAARREVYGSWSQRNIPTFARTAHRMTNGVRNAMRYSGTGFATQTPTFARVVERLRSMGRALGSTQSRLRSVGAVGAFGRSSVNPLDHAMATTRSPLNAGNWGGLINP